MDPQPVQAVPAATPVAAVPAVPVPQPQAVILQYAGFGQRLLAIIIDVVILSIVLVPLGFILNILGVILANATTSTVTTGSGAAMPTLITSLINSTINLIVSLGYPIYMIGSRGQTLGKMAMKIRVIRLDGQPVNYLTAFLRETIGKMLSSLLFLGYLWMLWDDKKQTWHDKIAGTIVVKV